MNENLCETCRRLNTTYCVQTPYPCRKYSPRDTGVLIVYLLFSLLIAMLFLASSCAKLTDTIPPTTPRYDGVYSGTMTYTLSGNPVTLDANRLIAGTTYTWFTGCSTLFNPLGNRYTIQATFTDSTLCQGRLHSWQYIWTGEGSIQGDSLVESGTLQYTYYINHQRLLYESQPWQAKYCKRVGNGV